MYLDKKYWTSVEKRRQLFVDKLNTQKHLKSKPIIKPNLIHSNSNFDVYMDDTKSTKAVKRIIKKARENKNKEKI